MSAFLRTSIAALALAGASALAAAQPPANGPVTEQAPPGWSFTPSLGVSQTWDDNVLLRGPGDTAPSEVVNVFDPAAALAFNGRRSQFSARYDGAISLYRHLDTLNSLDQHGSFDAKHFVSPHDAFVVSGSIAASPTTEWLQLPGVPFVRDGSTSADLRSGLEAALSKRLSIAAGARVERVAFDQSSEFANLLLGGVSVGGNFVMRERLSQRTTLTADYDVQRADIGSRHDIFDIQRASVGLERQLSEYTNVSASVGVSTLAATAFGPARTGPAWRLGISRAIRASVVEVLFFRSFIPSWSFGGTTNNEEITTRLRTPLSRRVYTQAMVSWQCNDPLVVAAPELRSLWAQATVGYTTSPWLRIEAYYLGSRQTLVLPDGSLDHNRFGLQVIASKPMRIR